MVVAELLTQRVVDLIEATGFPGLDPAQVLAMIAALLAGAGLVSVVDFALGDRDRLALLVAEPLPRGQSSVGIELALPGSVRTDELLRRLRRHAEHPAVDALVVVTSRQRFRDLPREIAGIPLRTAMIDVAPAATTSPASPPARPPA